MWNRVVERERTRVCADTSADSLMRTGFLVEVTNGGPAARARVAPFAVAIRCTIDLLL